MGECPSKKTLKIIIWKVLISCKVLEDHEFEAKWAKYLLKMNFEIYIFF